MCLLFSAVTSEHQQKPHDYICSGCKIWYLKNVWFLLGQPVGELWMDCETTWYGS